MSKHIGRLIAERQELQAKADDALLAALYCDDETQKDKSAAYYRAERALQMFDRQHMPDMLMATCAVRMKG